MFNSYKDKKPVGKQPNGNLSTLFYCLPLSFIIISATLTTVIVLALIPLYLPQTTVDVSRSNDTQTDLWALRFTTDLSLDANAVLIPQNDATLARTIDNLIGLQEGSVSVQQASLDLVRVDLSQVSNTRAFSDGSVICDFNVLLRLKYPTYCSDVSSCHQTFRKLSLLKAKNARAKTASLKLTDGTSINALFSLQQLTEFANNSGSADPLQSHIDRLLLKLRQDRMDSIMYWSLVSIETSGFDFDKAVVPSPDQPGPLRSSRAFAIISGSMYRAFQTAKNQASSALNDEQRSVYIKSAIMEAAYTSLSRLYPRQQSIFDAVRNDFVRRISPSNGRSEVIGNGASVGRSLAVSSLDGRENDGNQVKATYTPRKDFGYHQVDPLHSQQGFLSPKWGEVQPFVLKSGSQLRFPTSVGLDNSSRQAYLNSQQFRRDYEEVKTVGAKITPNRTTDEEEYSIFWAYDGAPKIGVPPRLYNQVAHKIALQQGNTIEQNARLFTMVNYALADAGIACWDAKYLYELWRPIVGIRQGTGSIPADPAWQPLGAPASGSGTDFTPNFPSYPSGHAAFGSAMFEVLRLFYGRDKIAFSFNSDEFNGITVDSRTGQPRPNRTRQYTSLTQAERENTLARIYLGIHWRIDQEEGEELGRRVGKYVFNNFI